MEQNENKKKTPQEKLEIKEFILDGKVFLISSSLHIVAGASLFMYYIIYLYYTKESIELPAFLTTTVIFIIMLVFLVLAYSSIRNLKIYITTLGDVLKEDENETN